MTMQMIVTKQKTKSMRPASRDAGWGSQGSRYATAAAMPPASVPRPTRVRIWLLRTIARLIEPATGTRRHPLHLRHPPNRKRRETTHGSRSWDLSRGRRRRARLCGEHERLRREHPHDRLDPADRRDHRHRPLDDLLVELGRPGLLRLAPPPDPRRPGPRSVLEARSATGLLCNPVASSLTRLAVPPRTWTPNGRPS